MTLAAVQILLSDSIDFFVALNAYLQDRSIGMVRGAQGPSRNVSLWEGKIAQENAQHELSKLVKALETLPSQDNFANLAQSKQIVLEHQYKTLVAKTYNYLLRAKELLEEFEFNSIRSLQMIPVPPHKKLAQALETTLKQCNDVLAKHAELFNKTVPKANKSWLTQELHYQGVMVASRATAFGLSKSTTPYPAVKVSEQSAQENFRFALDFFKEIAVKIGEVHNKTMRPTKITRQKFGVETATQKPVGNSLHWQYCPKGVEGTMHQLKTLIEDRKDNLDKAEVDALLDSIEFPKPKDPYRPW